MQVNKQKKNISKHYSRIGLLGTENKKSKTNINKRTGVKLQGGSQLLLF
jgi:hypothetical protein